jgi:hypothetical protein
MDALRIDQRQSVSPEPNRKEPNYLGISVKVKRGVTNRIPDFGASAGVSW